MFCWDVGVPAAAGAVIVVAGENPSKYNARILHDVVAIGIVRFQFAGELS